MSWWAVVCCASMTIVHFDFQCLICQTQTGMLDGGSYSQTKMVLMCGTALSWLEFVVKKYFFIL